MQDIKLVWKFRANDNNCCPRQMLTFEVAGNLPRGRLEERWMSNVNSDLKTLKLNQSLVQVRLVWERAIQPCKHNENELEPVMTMTKFH